MAGNPSDKKPLLIGFVLDDRLSREKTHVVARTLNLLRQEAQIEILPGETTEAQLLQKLQAPDAPKYHALLVPYYKYLTWSRVEAHLGITRASGTALAGYFADPITQKDLGPAREGPRVALIDFAQLEAAEAMAFVRSLSYENRRAGIRPFLEASTAVYCETWMAGQPLGPKLDAVQGLPEVSEGEWAKRSASLRLCISALWSLIYEEGPGKGDYAGKASATKAPKAYFQIAADSRTIALRLCYSLNSTTPKEILRQFWPDATAPVSAAQLLLRYADAVRVHPMADSPDLEVTAWLFPSKVAEEHPTNFRTLWIEPLSKSLVTEGAYEAPGDRSPHLRLLPSTGVTGPASPNDGEKSNSAKDRLLFDAAVKIRELKAIVSEKEDQLRELRSGGVGTAQPLPPPEAENLLEAFQDRYEALKDSIRGIELQIVQASQPGGDPEQVEGLRLKIQTLTQREKAWLQMIASTLEIGSRQGAHVKKKAAG